MARVRCEECGTALSVLARAHARYCSARCRVAASRARKRLPQQLTGTDRWVRHSAAKVPLIAGGGAGSVADSTTWTDYDTARRSRTGVGLGFVLALTDDIVCVDLDHCLGADGQPADWAAQLLEQAPPTFVEISPSGDGLHIWGTAGFLGGRRLARAGGAVEVYGSGRYITVTGRRYAAAPSTLGDLTGLLAHLM